MEPQTNTRLFAHVLYKTVPAGVAKNAPSGALHADVYLPQNGAGPFPAVFHWHGGGWMHGGKGLDGFLTPLVNKLAENGVAFLSFAYRLSDPVDGKVAFPMQADDVADGVRFFRANAAKYSLNPDRIAFMGTSAGAYLALMAGLAGPFFGEALPKDDYSAACRGILDICGPTDFFSQEKVASQEVMETCVAALLGKEGLADKALCYRASPASYACAASVLPPVFALQGQADELVHKTQAETLQKIYEARGGDFSLLKVENANHGFGPVEGLPPPSHTHKELLAASLAFLLARLL